VRIASAAAVARGSTMPEQMVDQNGQIRVPFAGQIMAAGRSPAQIEREIMSRLNGKAHEPQAIVRLVRNTTAAVTVVGDVASSTRVPLTPKGERLLDILSSAGGVKQPVGKTVIQVTRGARVISMPMEAVIKDPMQNVRLQADDVVTALFQPYSFTALGATSNNAEINFEATGLTLAQALGRVGGLRDERANVRGVFVFRMEDVRGVDPALLEGAQTTQDGKVPVIYRLNMSSPISFFVAQGFQMRNKDILYVSNAPAADLQKFVGIVSQMAFSVISIGNAVN
jgi:polysaccharide export outer membrane protein